MSFCLYFIISITRFHFCWACNLLSYIYIWNRSFSMLNVFFSSLTDFFFQCWPCYTVVRWNEIFIILQEFPFFSQWMNQPLENNFAEDARRFFVNFSKLDFEAIVFRFGGAVVVIFFIVVVNKWNCVRQHGGFCKHFA